MTRIVSYNLYACPHCNQAHLNPNYGSVSSYFPTTLLIDTSSLMTCQLCFVKSPFSAFNYLETLMPVCESANFFFGRELRDLTFAVKRFFNKSIVKPEKPISIHDKYPRLQA